MHARHGMMGLILIVSMQLVFVALLRTSRSQAKA